MARPSGIDVASMTLNLANTVCGGDSTYSVPVNFTDSTVTGMSIVQCAQIFVTTINPVPVSIGLREFAAERG